MHDLGFEPTKMIYLKQKWCSGRYTTTIDQQL